MRMGQGVRTGLGHGGITCVLQTQFSSFVLKQSPHMEISLESKIVYGSCARFELLKFAER